MRQISIVQTVVRQARQLAMAGAILLCGGATNAQVVPPPAPSAADAEKLKELGKAFVIYSNRGRIYRNDFSNGVATNKLLVDSGSNPTLSADGRLVAYVVYSGTVGDLYVVNSDGTGKRKINTTPIRHLSTPAFANDSRIVYGCGPKSVRPFQSGYGYYPQEVWLTDLQGSARQLLSNSGTGSYEYYNELDVHDDWVCWRWNANSYVGRFTQTPNKILNLKGFGQVCGLSLSPAGNEITTNNIPHTMATIRKRVDTTWTKAGTVNFVYEYEHLRFSNDPNWFTSDHQAGDAAVWAWNRQANRGFRITWKSGGRDLFGNLFFGDPGQPTRVTKSEKNNHTSFALLRSHQVGRLSVVDLAGRNMVHDGGLQNHRTRQFVNWVSSGFLHNGE